MFEPTFGIPGLIQGCVGQYKNCKQHLSFILSGDKIIIMKLLWHIMEQSEIPQIIYICSLVDCKYVFFKLYIKQLFVF